MSLVRRIAGTIRRRVLPDHTSLASALRRCASRDPHIATFIDIGASNGQWTVTARRYFPEARWLLLEAQPEHEPALAALKASDPRVDYVMAAAGDRVGELYFDASDLFGGLAAHEPTEGRCVVVPSVTVDHAVRERRLEGPFALKLDTHGFEVPILEGAAQTLRDSVLVVIEAYNFDVAEGSLRFHRMCAFMEERGFRCIDLCDPMHRPGDGALWQLDLFFVPADHALFSSNEYQ